MDNIIYIYKNIKYYIYQSNFPSILQASIGYKFNYLYYFLVSIQNIVCPINPMIKK